MVEFAVNEYAEHSVLIHDSYNERSSMHYFEPSWKDSLHLALDLQHHEGYARLGAHATSCPLFNARQKPASSSTFRWC